MAAWVDVPVAGEDDLIVSSHEVWVLQEDGDTCRQVIASGDGERTTFHEVVLDVNDDQCSPGLPAVLLTHVLVSLVVDSLPGCCLPRAFHWFLPCGSFCWFYRFHGTHARLTGTRRSWANE